jgi:hypothetical protein
MELSHPRNKMLQMSEQPHSRVLKSWKEQLIYYVAGIQINFLNKQHRASKWINIKSQKK